MRKKSDYVIEKHDSGKSAQKTVELKAVQKEGASYEFDILLDISANHLCSSEKDRTGLFDGRMPFDLSEDIGKELKLWAEDGEPVANEKPEVQESSSQVELYEDTTANKKLVMNHFKNMGLSMDTTAMSDIHAQMIGKEKDEAEKMLVNYCNGLKEEIK
jgi:hypothetical protein